MDWTCIDHCFNPAINLTDILSEQRSRVTFLQFFFHYQSQFS